MNPLPVILTVVADEPTITLEGDSEVIAGTGFDGVGVGALPPPPPQSASNIREVMSSRTPNKDFIGANGHWLRNMDGPS
jgi:hypothetical protein